MNDKTLRGWAQIGAVARLEELQREIAEIEAFLWNGKPARREESVLGLADVAMDQPKRSRRPMTDAEKKAHSKRMRAYWAKRRAKG